MFEHLGWDWRIFSAVIASFPAREVVIAVLGAIYAIGAEADEATLSERLHSASWPDRNRIFNIARCAGAVSVLCVVPAMRCHNSSYAKGNKRIGAGCCLPGHI